MGVTLVWEVRPNTLTFRGINSMCMSVLMAVTLSGFSLGESIGRSRSDQEERKVENRERSASDSLCLIKNLQKSRLKKKIIKRKKKASYSLPICLFWKIKIGVGSYVLISICYHQQTSLFTIVSTE